MLTSLRARTIGDTFRINGVGYRVAGIYETSAGFEDNGAVIPLSDAQRAFDKRRQVSFFKLKRRGAMNDTLSQVTNTEVSTTTSYLVGLYSAILTTVITVVTFSFAIVAIPISGANCSEGCIGYPYLDTVSQFPRDYVWMLSAIILVLVYVVLMVSIHAYSAKHTRIFSQIGLSFAMIAASILLSTYFVQFSVVPVSLMNGETEGITLLTQYNPHGIFIALEELGYLIMSLSLLFMAPVFTNKGRLESAVRWVFIAGFILMVASLTVISINYGLDRKDRFEVAVISIDWLVLIISGVLLSIVFRRQLIAERDRFTNHLGRY